MKRRVVDNFSVIVKVSTVQCEKFEKALAKMDAIESAKHLNYWILNHSERSRLIKSLIEFQVNEGCKV